MEDIFISSIEIENVRNIQDLNIDISPEKRTHVVFTGKNGSGKTSLLSTLHHYLGRIEGNTLASYDIYLNNLDHYEREYERLRKEGKKEADQVKLQLESSKRTLINFKRGVKINFNKNYAIVQDEYNNNNLLIKFFNANRLIKFDIPKGPHTLNVDKYTLSANANQQFLQFIVNLKADKAFARDDNDNETVEKIENWFKKFEDSLELILSEKVKLVFDRKQYNFNLRLDDNREFNFNVLADGYSAFLNIVTEIMMRMQTHEISNYNEQGIVLIDEIETHLHVELQKKILPFLISLFPNIQFIVSTHSPFILTSISNAVICDLEKRIITKDLSSYSYDAIIESYFGVDKYSDKLKQMVKEYEQLNNLNELNEEQKNNLREIEKYLQEAPKSLASELLAKLQEIKLKRLTKEK